MTQQDYTDDQYDLPGMEPNMPDEFQKLAQLISQDQFDWLPDGRVVFLMNDAVESFLVFLDGKLTGNFDTDYDGELEAYLDRSGEAYMLIVHQGTDNVFTIHFTDLKLEVHLYNYGEIGHFWVEGQEDLRQLEYKLAILRDKIQYLGDEYANDEELHLAALADFPPIMTWYAVPAKYRGIPEEPWYVTEKAVCVMMELAVEAGDHSLLRILKIYRMLAEKSASMCRKQCGRYIARTLTHSSHTKVLQLLAKRLRHAAKSYPDRTYQDDLEHSQPFHELWLKTRKKAQELRSRGVDVEALREEPFVVAADSITYHVYLMYRSKGAFRKRVTVELMQREDENQEEQ